MQFLKYTALRLALFFTVFIGLAWGLRWNLYAAGAVALVFAFCVSYLFFNRLRIAATEELRDGLAGRRSRHKGSVELDDEAAEDGIDPGADPRPGTGPRG
ncbi:DUF4229 domain-containing protein [Zafaria sp. Z1313]|uniref:DUF4229 domain-containing protein n=1 Tax=unclassified Zafaria TaxID=2828765 RepID=UPI002E7A3767|nr:DUF4229 domain-containing protein [Zafaria sp. J156]MEE1621311.1 DUF4229 domain-containing protein [Zafaria sp. J156]